MAGLSRRSFFKTAAVGAAALGAKQDRETKSTPLPNRAAPASQFQAYPGGTGAYLDRLLRANKGRLPKSPKIEVEPWKGAVPRSEEEIAFLPVHRLAALIQAGKLSPVELTDLYLKRLKKHDETLLFAVTILEESARKEAKKAEEEIKSGIYRGPLHGIPWGAKDLLSAKGAPTTWGVKPFEDRVIDEDSEVVRRLKKAGAILIAKLSVGTFALGDLWYRGRTRNPWNPRQGSSGSSAGPASATVAGCVGFSIGTETLGSIVSPSKRCGITSLRPTFGRVSRHGCMTLSWSMDKIGPICRTVEDCALVFAAIHGADPKDLTTATTPFRFERKPDLSKMKIGYTRRTNSGFLDKLRELGADPKEMPRFPRAPGLTELTVEEAAAMDDFMNSDNPDKMVNKGRTRSFEGGRTVTALKYLDAQRKRLEMMWKMHEIMEDFDVFVSSSGDLALTNLTGHPTVTLPYAFRSQPRCICIVGDLFGDDKALSVAHAYQAATDWHTRHPEL